MAPGRGSLHHCLSSSMLSAIAIPYKILHLLAHFGKKKSASSQVGYDMNRKQTYFDSR